MSKIRRRLNLMTLKGEEGEKSYLEIEIYPNDDIFVIMNGQDISGEYHEVNAQMPNPNTGSGIKYAKVYRTLLQIYKTLGKRREVKMNDISYDINKHCPPGFGAISTEEILKNL